MDFIERLFGLAPDGGSGMLEFLLLLVPVAGIVVVHVWRRSVKRPRRTVR